MTCNLVAHEDMNNGQAAMECDRLGLKPPDNEKELRWGWLLDPLIGPSYAQDDPTHYNKIIPNTEPLKNVKWLTLTNNSLVWIGNQIERQSRSRSRSRNKDESTEASQTVTDSLNSRNVYCQAWSVRKFEFQSVPCDTKLEVFCQADLIGM